MFTEMNSRRNGESGGEAQSEIQGARGGASGRRIATHATVRRSAWIGRYPRPMAEDCLTPTFSKGGLNEKSQFLAAIEAHLLPDGSAATLDGRVFGREKF